MDFTKIMAELSEASLFELFRLKEAIKLQLDDPKRQQAVKRRLREGQEIQYFDQQYNGLITATVLEVRRTRVLVQNIGDGKRWTLPLYFLNLEGVDTHIENQRQKGVDRASLSVGDKVCFRDRSDQEHCGVVEKLNPKTAQIRVGREKWRCYYSTLTPVIEGELADAELLLEGEVISSSIS
ncbi:MAG: hypothetical protein HQL48_07950 [Gammaproteobacteria bacterium]|nr:hypothetical protein [Gammaproteobacteria bacterium]